MPKYLVTGRQIINPTMVVEARDKLDAVGKAWRGEHDAEHHQSADNAEMATNTDRRGWIAEEL